MDLKTAKSIVRQGAVSEIVHQGDGVTVVECRLGPLSRRGVARRNPADAENSDLGVTIARGRAEAKLARAMAPTDPIIISVHLGRLP